MEIILGELNLYSNTWDVTAGVGTLVVSNIIGFDMSITNISRIENTTLGESFTIDPLTTFEQSIVSGKPVYTWVFNNLPESSATGDTLVIYLNVSPQQAEFATNQFIATNVVV